MTFALLVCLIILADKKTFAFQPYKGPFPAELPAGHCLLTDGEKWTTRGWDAQMGKFYTLGADSDTPAEAIEFAWIMREIDRENQHQRRQHRKDRNWRPANPELCKEGNK